VTRDASRRRKAVGAARRGGFSLIELAVVVAVIIVIVSVMLPALARLRVEARKARWAGFIHHVRADDRLIALYDFRPDGSRGGAGVDGVAGDSTAATGASAASDEPVLRNIAVTPRVAYDNQPGKRLHGRFVSTGLAEVGRGGKSGAMFDGLATRIECGSNAGLDLGDAFTVMAWVKRDQPTSASEGILNTHDSDLDLGFTFFVHQQRLVMQFGDGGGGWPYSKTNLSNRRLELGRWHHVAAVRDRTAMRYYIDGELDSTWAVGPNPARIGPRAMWIGADTNRPGQAHFRGAIDEVVLYGRALGEAEVRGWFEMGWIE
jgi:hypothetical protein